MKPSDRKEDDAVKIAHHPFHRSYATGAVCSLRPKSSKQEVDRFLQLMGLEEDANKQVIIRELCNGEFTPLPMTLHHFLTPTNSSRSTTIMVFTTSRLNHHPQRATDNSLGSSSITSEVILRVDETVYAR
jgi:sulfite reductase alpha subunit-like flavoprotein